MYLLNGNCNLLKSQGYKYKTVQNKVIWFFFYTDVLKMLIPFSNLEANNKQEMENSWQESSEPTLT